MGITLCICDSVQTTQSGRGRAFQGTMSTILTFLLVFLPSVLQVEPAYTDKKENQIFLIYKEIQSGEVPKSYMRKGFQIQYMRKCATILHL
jgi:hypothetical protein